MVPVVDSSLLTQKSTILTLLLFASLSVCNFALLLQLPILLQPIPRSFLCRIIHNKNSFWCRRNIQRIRLYLLSRLCDGLLCCHSKVIFVLNPIFSMHHWKPSMPWPVSIYYFHLQRLQAHYLVQSISCFTPSLVDLESILEAIVLSWTYSKLQNPLGIVPSFPMVMICICWPMSQISSHYANKIKETSESCRWLLKIPKRERCSCWGGTWQDDFHQEESQHCFWETTTKRNTSIWVLSCWKSVQNKCLVMDFLTVLTFVLVGVFPKQESGQQRFPSNASLLS